jgi:hypothetical protein
MHVHTCIYAFVYMRLKAFAAIDVLYKSMYIRTYVCMCVCVCMYMCVCVFMYVCMYVHKCVCVCVCVCMYVCRVICFNTAFLLKLDKGTNP